MASYLYGLARQKFLDGDLDWSAHDIQAMLVDGADYTPTQNTDEFHDDIAGGGIVATSGNFASKTSTLGTADAADVTFTSVTGDPCEDIIIMRWTGVSGTSPLIAKIDDYTRLPVTPNGGNINVAWPASGIFVL